MEDYHKDLAPLTPNQTTTTPRIPQNKPEKKSPMEEESFNCHLCKKQAGKKPWKYTKSSLQKHIEMVHEGKNPAVLSSPVVQAPATPVSYAQIVSKNIVSKDNVVDKKVSKPKVSENITVDESKSKKIDVRKLSSRIDNLKAKNVSNSKSDTFLVSEVEMSDNLSKRPKKRPSLMVEDEVSKDNDVPPAKVSKTQTKVSESKVSVPKVIFLEAAEFSE